MADNISMKFSKIISAALIGVAFICYSSVFAGIYKFKNKNKYAPQNVIVMISDGCGYHHVDAASYYQYGKTGLQVFEHFPTRLALSTYMYNGGYEPASAWEN